MTDREWERQRRRDLLSIGPLLKWPLQLELGQGEGRNLKSHLVSWVSFCCHISRALGSWVQQLGLQLAFLWDAGIIGNSSAVMLQFQPHNFKIFQGHRSVVLQLFWRFTVLLHPCPMAWCTESIQFRSQWLHLLSCRNRCSPQPFWFLSGWFAAHLVLSMKKWENALPSSSSLPKYNVRDHSRHSTGGRN